MNDYTRLRVKKILYCVSMMCLAAFFFFVPYLCHSDAAHVCNEPRCCLGGGGTFLSGPLYVPEHVFLDGQVKSVA